jgi:hypothetical protein
MEKKECPLKIRRTDYKKIIQPKGKNLSLDRLVCETAQM